MSGIKRYALCDGQQMVWTDAISPKPTDDGAYVRYEDARDIVDELVQKIERQAEVISKLQQSITDRG